MKTKLLTATLIAAMLVPATGATAQTREIRRERQDVREAQRDVREARRYGDRDDVRDARRDVRDERRDVRQAREDWREYRQRNRELYRGSRFNAPFRYQRFGNGAAIDARYYGDRYTVGNYARYRLPAPGRYQRYVRHYNDVLLVNTRTGRVVRVYNGFYW